MLLYFIYQGHVASRLCNVADKVGNMDERSDLKIKDKPNPCYEVDNDGKICNVWFLVYY